MLDLTRRLLYQTWVGFWNIGYKKRIAIQVLFVLTIVSLVARPFFFANLSDLTFFQRSSNVNASNSLWERWAHNAGYRYFRSIGDVYDKCEEKPRGLKAGKVFVYFDEREHVPKAVVVANFTMRAGIKSGTVHVVAKYHGRTMYDRKHDLCKADVDTFSCPLKEGQDMRIFETFKLPKYIPKGRYFSQALVYNQDGKCIVVAESDFKV